VRRAILITGAAALLLASPAEGSITLGQIAPSPSTPQNCGPTSGGYTQPTVTSGASYVAPTPGRIISWSTAALATAGQKMTLRILRPLGGASYLGVSHDGPRSLSPSAVNTFFVDLPVQRGDVLSLDPNDTSFPTACGFVVPGELELGSFPNPPPDDGASATFTPNPGDRLNVSAQFDPSNAFSFGTTTRNKKKGRATTTVSLPGPGTVVLQGKGLKVQSITTTLSSVGLGVIPNSKTRKKLLQKGKVRVTPSVTYTPTGGTANTQSETVKLIAKS
jgi:hypothetical protein